MIRGEKKNSKMKKLNFASLSLYSLVRSLNSLKHILEFYFPIADRKGVLLRTYLIVADPVKQKKKKLEEKKVGVEIRVCRHKTPTKTGEKKA